MIPSKDLVKQITGLKGSKEVERFLLGILTPQEIEQLNQRLEIVKLLKKGMPQREIAQKLGVGIATVTRGAREIRMGRFGNI